MTPDHLAAATPDCMEQAPILVATRFSFLGQSGWKSDASRSAEMLFEADRLNRRLELFCTITLPSLAAQTDQGFHHFILTSKQLPDWAMEVLRTACMGIYGDESRFTILAGRPGPARRALRVFLESADGFELVGEAENGADAVALVPGAADRFEAAGVFAARDGAGRRSAQPWAEAGLSGRACRSCRPR